MKCLSFRLLICSSFLTALTSLVAGQPNQAGQIVYIGIDSNIYLLDPDTMVSTQLTDDARATNERSISYQYPTWSRTGELAFVRYDASSDGRQNVSIGRYRPGSRVSYTDHLDGVVPFYLYFSPGGRYLSMLGNQASAGTLGLLLLPRNESAGRVVASGQPFYWDWLPGDDEFVVHSGGSTRSDEISVRSVREDSIEETGVRPGVFQAPAVGPKGRLVALARNRDGETELIVSNRDASLYHSFPSYPGVQAFDWSPTKEILAVVEGRNSPMGGLIGNLKLLDLGDPENPIVTNTGIENSGPFFWSPDGRWIAVFRPNVLRGDSGPVLVMRVDIYDVERNTNRRIASYVPDIQFLAQVAPFYDQYQRSATIWSPDSSRIVITATTPDRLPGIFVLDIDERVEDQLDLPAGSMPVVYRPVRHNGEYVAGRYPFWSW